MGNGSNEVGRRSQDACEAQAAAANPISTPADYPWRSLRTENHRSCQRVDIDLLSRLSNQRGARASLPFPRPPITLPPFPRRR